MDARIAVLEAGRAGRWDELGNDTVTGREDRQGPARNEEIERLSRQGIGLDAIANRFGLKRATVARIVNEARALRLRERKVEPMYHPSFDDLAARDEILGPMPAGKTAKPSAPDRFYAEAPEGVPPYLAELYRTPLLNREQEAHLFRKTNYLKYQAALLIAKLDPTHAGATALEEIERLLGEALAVKNQIIRANLRLVVSIAKRRIGQNRNFFELVSDGNVSLIRAVEKFDYSRGNKFSTYATWAIVRNFARTIPEEDVRRERFRTGHDEVFDAAAIERGEESESESKAELLRNREVVQGMIGRLDERERRIIISRFGLDGSGALTLEQLGKELGVTKERVRQLETRAKEKMRKFAAEKDLDPTAL